MKTPKSSLSLAAGGLSALAATILLLWLFSLEGTKGLFEWENYRSLFIGVGLLGLIPLLLALAAGLLGGSGRGEGRPAGSAKATRRNRLGKALGISASLLSLLVLAGVGLLAGGILQRSRELSLPLPAPNILDPAKGILPRGGLGEEGRILRLSLSSDPHWGAESANASAREAVLRGLASAEPARDAFFILGDNVELGMNEAPWRAEALALASILPEMPIRPLLGNHDALVDGQYHFRKYYFEGAGSDSGSPYYYSMEAGPATLIVLNLLWGAESLDKAQRRWLEARLAAIPRERPLIVLSHSFILSSGYLDEDTGKPWYDKPELAAYLCPLFERSGVDLVVSGHNHYMELLERGGVRYAVVGAMGGVPDPEPSYLSPYSSWFKRGSFGRLDLDIDTRGMELRFVDTAGAILHRAYIPAGR